eukprot:632392-Karenia_brevis.AAC.1
MGYLLKTPGAFALLDEWMPKDAMGVLRNLLLPKGKESTKVVPKAFMDAILLVSAHPQVDEDIPNPVVRSL